MKKNIWIWNHYATNMFFDRDGRHYRFAKYLREAGYNPTIFCASTIHNTDNAVKISQGIYKTDMIDGIPFIFVKTPPYQGNGLARIKNMLTFAHRVKRVAKKLPSVQKPDVILASSVHPFTCIAGILTAKTLGVPCIVEIRDLWPESIVAYQNRSRKNPAILALYQLEKWIYKKADRLVFTMEGGKDYIRERGWAKDIDLNKVRHINNGVDLEEFDDNATKYILNDTDLNNSDTFKIVYAGSIRAVNNLLPVMEAAKILQENGQKQIQFLIYGSGNELTLLRQYQQENQLKNVNLKGRVGKKYIPFIVSKADLNLIHVRQSPITRFGISLNKLFDYLASGKPVLSDLSCNYDLIERYQCGQTISTQAPSAIASAVFEMGALTDEKYNLFCTNARQTVYDYNYKKLTQALIHVIEEVSI